MTRHLEPEGRYERQHAHDQHRVLVQLPTTKRTLRTRLRRIPWGGWLLLALILAVLALAPYSIYG